MQSQAIAPTRPKFLKLLKPDLSLGSRVREHQSCLSKIQPIGDLRCHSRTQMPCPREALHGLGYECFNLDLLGFLATHEYTGLMLGSKKHLLGLVQIPEGR